MAKQLIVDQRVIIKKRRIDQNWSLRDTAEEAGVTHVTVKKEIERNTPPGRPDLYNPHLAQARCMRVRAERGCRFNRAICAEIERRINAREKVDSIVIGMSRMRPPMKVGRSTIYSYVQIDKEEGGRLYRKLPMYKFVRRRGLRRRGAFRNRIRNAVCVTRRPKHILKRKRYGDLEVDLMAGRRGTGYLLVVIERKSRWGWVAKMPDKNPKRVRRLLVKMLLGYKVKTMTYDRGMEFKYHAWVNARLGCKSYFCRPRCPTDKGSVERWIRRLREVYPKGSSLENVTQGQVNLVTLEINQTRFTHVLHGKKPWDHRNKVRLPSPRFEQLRERARNMRRA